MRWDDAVEGFWLDRRRSLSKATQRDYALTFRRFGEWIKGGEVEKVKPSQVNRFLEYLGDELELSQKTVLNAWIALSSFWTWVAPVLKVRHVMQEVERPTPTMRMMQAYSEEEVRRLLAAMAGRSWLDARDRLIVLLLFFSGLRVSELCGLDVADVDSVRCEVLVRWQHAKGEKSRVVPCVDDVRPALASYLYSRPAHDAALLLASDGYAGVTGRLTREGVRQMLIRRCQAAGIEYYNPHAFRHGFAMWLLNSGARLTTVSTAMGHSDTAITSKTYAHTTTVTVRREYEEALRRVRRP